MHTHTRAHAHNTHVDTHNTRAYTHTHTHTVTHARTHTHTPLTLPSIHAQHLCDHLPVLRSLHDCTTSPPKDQRDTEQVRVHTGSGTKELKYLHADKICKHRLLPEHSELKLQPRRSRSVSSFFLKRAQGSDR